jgi:hypothetical protein
MYEIMLGMGFAAPERLWSTDVQNLRAHTTSFMTIPIRPNDKMKRNDPSLVHRRFLSKL